MTATRRAAAVARLDAEMRALVDGQARAGIAYGVMIDGDLAALGSHGLANRETHAAMTPDTIVRLFSMSRAVTTVAFLTLVEEGRVALDDPVSTWLPAFADTPVLKSADGSIPGVEPQARPITIRMLLTYSSGLGYPFAYPPDLCVEQASLMGEGIGTAEGIDRIARLPLFEQPGTRWRYGFSGDVLGRIAEVVSGLPLDRFLQERLFDRIGMPDTGFWVPPDKIDRLAKAYGPVGADRLADVNATWQAEFGTFDAPRAFLSAGGGLASTTRDYLRFLQMLLNDGAIDGVRILRPETIGEMLTGHVPLAPGVGYQPHMRFGYGLGVLDEDGPRPFGIAGREAGWGGLANTQFYIDPAHRLAAVGMTQYFGDDPDRFTDAFRTAVYRLIAEG